MIVACHGMVARQSVAPVRTKPWFLLAVNVLISAHLDNSWNIKPVKVSVSYCEINTVVKLF